MSPPCATSAFITKRKRHILEARNIAIVIVGMAVWLDPAAYAQNRNKKPDADDAMMQKIKRPDSWDCTAGGRIRQDRFDVAGVEQGIAMALRVLKQCETCRKLFGKDDPIELLNQLVRINAILVTDVLPQNLKGTGPKGALRIGDLKGEWDSRSVAKTYDVLPVRPGSSPMRAPCIFINPNKMMVTNDRSQYGGVFTLAEARAVVILHELAHALGAVPWDGNPLPEAEALQQSDENNRCIMKNCIPCREPGPLLPCLKLRHPR